MDLLTSLFLVDTLKLYFAEEISCDPIDFVKLRVAAAKGAMVRIFKEPLRFTVRTYGLFTYFAF